MEGLLLWESMSWLMEMLDVSRGTTKQLIQKMVTDMCQLLPIRDNRARLLSNLLNLGVARDSTGAVKFSGK
eukprot:9443016-Karenia_brevis.AAC.1